MEKKNSEKIDANSMVDPLFGNVKFLSFNVTQQRSTFTS